MILASFLNPASLILASDCLLEDPRQCLVASLPTPPSATLIAPCNILLPPVMEIHRINLCRRTAQCKHIIPLNLRFLAQHQALH
mmetsp:Transcript_15110/g.21014  ORF Transcript_15110/g.21014 Transcript_15110/m.21014 type:complete len:84 (+) Transcript_15110:220-471(+)